MTKEEYITFWLNQSDEDWQTALYLKEGKKNLMLLFMLHLVIEKILKAQWIKDNEDNIPPRTHNLQFIAQQTKLKFEEKDYAYLAVISSWNIQSRYPDYKLKAYKIATDDYCNMAILKTEKIRKWMLEQMQ